MVRVVAVLLLAGCFDPAAQVGAPCPDGACPSGQQCDRTQSPPICVVDPRIGDGGIENDAPPLGSFTVGGTVSGLAGTLVLQNNGGDDLTRTSDGAFTFAAALGDGTSYAVTVAVAPPGQSVVLSNATGTIAGADVADVTVTCTTSAVDPGIACGTAFCDSSTDRCCHGEVGDSATCVTQGAACGGIAMPCSDSHDCGELPNICCAKLDTGGQLTSVACTADTTTCTPQGNGSVQYLCDPGAAQPCPNAKTCVSDPVRGWNYCQ